MTGPAKERLARRALELCRIPSPIGDERAIADHLEAWARRHFSPGEVLRCSNSLALGHAEDPRPAVLLLGHVDTVLPHARQEAPQIVGDRLFGLGSADMKSGVAVMVELAESVPDTERVYNLMLAFYEREEGPYLENGLGPLLERAPFLKGAKLAVLLEPTDGRVQLGCLGSVHATVRFQGRSAHAARPWEGKNAIHAAGAFLEELARHPLREVNSGGCLFREVLSATLARGGRARNVVPDSFELNLNFRFAPGRTVEEARAEILAKVAGRAEVEFSDLSPSGRVCADNPYLQRLLWVTGSGAEAKQAWTDVARLSEMGMDAVNFGPGETAKAHQADESTSLAALELAFDRLSAFLRGR